MMLFVFSIISGFLLYILFTKTHFRFFNFVSASPIIAVLFIGLLTVLLTLLFASEPFLFYILHTFACSICFPIKVPTPIANSQHTSEVDRQHKLRHELEQRIVQYLEHFSLPILSMLIGGAPLAMLTLLVGAKSNRQGMVSNVLFFLPSRIGAFFMLTIIGLCKHDFKNARNVYQKDHNKHPFRALSQILAVYSGALHLCFPTPDGRLIGNMNRPIALSDIPLLEDLILYSCWFMILFGCFVRILLCS